MTPITGNTFPVKDQLRALGGRWDAAKKCWMVPDNKVEEAAALLFPGYARPVAMMKESARKAAVGAKAPASPARVPRTCKDCGCRINYGVYCGKCEYR